MVKRYTFLISFVLLLFISLFTLLCWHSRLATDDYWYIHNVNTNGILISVKNQYLGWCGRYVSELARDVMYHCFQLHEIYYRIIPFLTFVLLLTGVYHLLKNFSAYFNYSISASLIILSSISICALLFFLSLDKGESWFWYNAIHDYVLSIAVFVWGLVLLFDKSKSIFANFCIIICMIYVGGGSEVYSSIFSLLTSLFILFRYKSKIGIREFFNSTFNIKLLVFFISLCISFLIVIIAPGNYYRAGLLPKSHFFYSFFIASKSMVKFLILFIPLQIPYIIAFSVPFILLGKRNKTVNEMKSAVSFKQLFMRITTFYLALLFVFSFVVAYLMQEMGPARVWLLASFITTVYLVIVSFLIGKYSNVPEKFLGYLQITSILIGIGFTSFYIFQQYSIVSAYSSAVDKRNASLIEMSRTIQHDSLIKLAPLPPCGMLYSAEITADTAHFTNQQLRAGYDLKFHVYVEK